MPYFNYSGYDSKGKSTKGTIEAGSSIQAVDRLTERGIFVVDVKLAEEKKGKVKIKMLPLDLHIFFCRSIASYLKSGLPLADALRIMSKQTRDKTMKPVMEKLLAEVQGGRKFHTALAESGAFRESLWRVAESGQQMKHVIQEFLVKNYPHNLDNFRQINNSFIRLIVSVFTAYSMISSQACPSTP